LHLGLAEAPLKSYVRKVDFPYFLTDLIKGLFNAKVNLVYCVLRRAYCVLSIANRFHIPILRKVLG